MERTIDIPDGIDVSQENGSITVSADGAEVTRTLDHPDVEITVDGDTVTVSTASTKRDVTAIVGTYTAHIENMIDGVTNGYEYVMQGFYQHFPMDLSVQGDTFVISNFIGERSPREIPIPDSVEIEVDGEDVVVRGPDKEAVGQTAASIEQACYKGKRDPRKFQDGVYITERRVMSDE